jgi:preprotein translocase subunit SecE
MKDMKIIFIYFFFMVFLLFMVNSVFGKQINHSCIR